MKGCSETFDSKTFLIAKSLNHFMHDAEGLGAIVRNEAFLDKILLLLQKYCTETKSIRCSASESKITLRPDSPNFLLHLEEKRQSLVRIFLLTLTWFLTLGDSILFKVFIIFSHFRMLPTFIVILLNWSLLYRPPLQILLEFVPR